MHPEDPNARTNPRINELRQVAVRLAREEVTALVEEAQRNRDADPAKTTSVKKSILGKLKRLLPGQANSIGAILREDGTVTKEPAAMAKAIKDHWSKVFAHKQIDETMLERWFASLKTAWGAQEENAEPSLDNGNPLPHMREKRKPIRTDPGKWATRRKDIIKALKLAGNSSPGPDGIPFAAWRALKGIGITVLYDVARALRSESSQREMSEAFADIEENGGHNYNLSTLVCLPKAATGEDPEFGAYFKPSDARPLSIVNCDNRLVASAIRMRWEDNLDDFIRQRQQGFLRGRSISRNLVEVDNAMLIRSLQDDNAAAVFLDFAAAFPSISQEYCQRVLEDLEAPEAEVRPCKHHITSPGAWWQ